MKKTKIKQAAVAMSGGVDSSVAAALLKKQGYEVIGVFFEFWSKNNKQKNICCSNQALLDAKKVAKKLDIKLKVINLKAKFKEKVVDDFIFQYKNCLTPNPCVKCNQYIKFGEALNQVKKLGVDYLATGHYCRLQRSKQVNIKLLKGKDKQKDQSYFLYRLKQSQLRQILFPVGNFNKDQVRKLAKELDLPVAQKKESQEVCFVPKQGLPQFLSKYFKLKKGPIKDIETKKVLGEHLGLAIYTIGQRKGIGLAGGPWFVVQLDKKNNVLWVTKNPKLITNDQLLITQLNWISGKQPKLPIKIKCRIRYGAKPAGATVFQKQKQIFVKFNKPQKAITPGQSAVFWQGQECLGGGIIKTVI